MKFFLLSLVLSASILLPGCQKATDTATETTSTQEAKKEKSPQTDPFANQDIYTPFTPEKFEAVHGKKKVVVFFHADWCATCKAWEKTLGEKLNSLPKNTVILKANYDTDKDLVEKWHIKSQSSALFFNEKGEIIDNIMDPKIEAISDFFETSTQDNITKAGDKYEVYSQKRYDELKGKQKILVFFYADWCATCRAWEKKLMSSLESLPENTKVLKANYDTNTELKKEFGIKMQSVAAFIGADGELVKTEADPKMDSLTAFFKAE